jgi:hypothetical protein
MQDISVNFNYCDDCVSRGCSCHEDPETGIADVDEHGKLFPCYDYDYFPEGLDLEELKKPLSEEDLELIENAEKEYQDELNQRNIKKG